MTLLAASVNIKGETLANSWRLYVPLLCLLSGIKSLWLIFLFYASQDKLETLFYQV